VISQINPKIVFHHGDGGRAAGARLLKLLVLLFGGRVARRAARGAPRRGSPTRSSERASDVPKARGRPAMLLFPLAL